MARLSRLLPVVAFVVSLVITIPATAKPSEASPVKLVWSDVDFPLGTAINGNFTRTEEEVSHCYEPTLRDGKLNIFNESLSFLSVVSYYYRAFPTKPISRSSLTNLLASTRQIVAHCIEPQRQSAVRYGYTSLSDMSQEEFNRLLGAREPEATQRKQSARCDVDKSKPLPGKVNYRETGCVSPVKDQGGCGSCWVFAAIGSAESAVLIKGQRLPKGGFSEQRIVDCVFPDGCDGGWGEYALEYSIKNGLSYEYEVPYTATDGHCRTSYPSHFYLEDYCTLKELDDATMQRVIHQHGPAYVVVNGEPLQHYRGGIVNSPDCDTTPDHAVLLVGYDTAQNAWILKNSWSTYWGEEGFFRMVMGRNMCRVNTEAVWPILLDKPHSARSVEL